MKKAKGFTLIEVMIVVAIVALLAAVALPSYQQHVQKSRRTDAMETLTRMATLQERYFFQNSRYARQGNVVAFNELGGDTSPEGWYQIAMTHTNGTCGSDTDACNNFTITATAIGPQVPDERCRTFTITQSLQQTAEDVNGADTTDECW